MFLSWADIMEQFKILAGDSKELQKKIDSLIEKRMKIVIKKLHPHDHKEFKKKNKEFLEKLKQEFVQKYTKEADEKIRGFIVMADFKNKR